MTESEQDSVDRIRAFRFGEFEMRPASHELLRNGQAVVVQPKVFDFIAYLVVNRSRLVDKNELLEAVWPRQIVTEAALSRCVMKARRALDEDAENPRAIHTVHGRGFRFVAEVYVVVRDDAEAHSESGSGENGLGSSPPPTGQVDVPEPMQAESGSVANVGIVKGARMRVLVRSAWILLGLIVAMGLVWFVQRPGADKFEGSGQIRVAVLPIENMTGDARQDWARLGLMTAIDEILRVEGPVQVMGAREVVDLDSEEKDPDSLDERLREVYKVTHIVRGKVQQNAGQLRLDYRVTNAEGSNRRRSVVAADIGSLAHAAGADLRIVLGLTGDRAEVTTDSFANEAYLRGRALRLQGDVAGSQKYYALAMEQAPESFWPRYEHALGLRDLGDREAAEARLRELMKEADTHGSARQGSSVRNALAIMSWRNGDLDTAATLLDEAYQMSLTLDDPDRSSGLLINLAILAKNRDQLDVARDYLNQAAELELAAGKEMPSGNVMHTLGQVELKLGDLESAGKHFQSAIDRFELVGERRNAAIAGNSLANLRWREARTSETRALFEKTLEQHRELGNRSAEATSLIGLGQVELDQGHLSTALEFAQNALLIVDELKEIPKSIDATSLLGEIEEARQDHEAARRWQLKALDNAREINETDSVLRLRLLLAGIDWRTGKMTDAEQEALAVRDEAQAGGYVLREIDALILMARMQGDASNWEPARASLKAAMALLDSVNDPRRKAAAQLAFAEIDLGAGDIAAATAQLRLAEPVLGTSREYLQLRAVLAAAQGNADAALDAELAAKAAAAETWTLEDEKRLSERRRAAS
ncbi:tetratricopeptide repeat protein [Dokdonella sp.]|uniref:tetratricopeptide repeat protein n=1 Tax=Dokdonella sp. TaxID=2291710 RepID=UPI003528F90B